MQNIYLILIIWGENNIESVEYNFDNHLILNSFSIYKYYLNNWNTSESQELESIGNYEKRK